MNNEVSERLEDIKEAIMAEALEEIRTLYSHERYHNPEHSALVHHNALRLAEALPPDQQLTLKEMALLELVATAHDVRYNHDPRHPDYHGQNEMEAAMWLVEKMQQHPDIFDRTDCVIAHHAILSTYAKPMPGRRPDGWSDETTIQQNSFIPRAAPDHLIGRLLCDADLSGLGSSWEIYNETSSGYYLELYPDGGTLNNWIDYLNLQQLLLENRVYYTGVAQEMYQENLRMNLLRTKSILADESLISSSHETILRLAANKKKL